MFKQHESNTTLSRIQTYAAMANTVANEQVIPSRYMDGPPPNVYAREFSDDLHSLLDYTITDSLDDLHHIIVGFLELMLYTAEHDDRVRVTGRLGAGSYSVAYAIDYNDVEHVFKVNYHRGYMSTYKLKYIFHTSTQTPCSLPVSPLYVTTLDMEDQRVHNSIQPMWVVTDRLHPLTPMVLRGNRDLANNAIECVAQCVKSAEYYGEYAQYDLKLNNFMYNPDTNEVFLTDLDLCRYNPSSTYLSRIVATYTPYFSDVNTTHKLYLRGMAMQIMYNIRALFIGMVHAEIYDHTRMNIFLVRSPYEDRTLYTWAFRLLNTQWGDANACIGVRRPPRPPRVPRPPRMLRPHIRHMRSTPFDHSHYKPP